MTYRRRADWTPIRAANSHPFVAADVAGVAIHWNGPPVSVGALADPRVFLRGVLRFHTAIQKWSDIAYNLAVDQNGDVWELRGLGHRSAANGDTGPNRRYVAIYCVIGEGQHPSSAMLAGVRHAIALTRKKYPKATQIKTHRDVRPEATACPGPDLTRAVREHDLEPLPPKPPTSEGDDMPHQRYTANDGRGEYIVTVEGAVHIKNPTHRQLLLAEGRVSKTVKTITPDQLDELLEKESS